MRLAPHDPPDRPRCPFARGVRVLSIGRLSLARADYYLDSVGKGADDYYNEAGEAPGRWVGNASELLALSGRVEGDDFRAILEGKNPETGTALLRSHNRTVSGFDLTFRAPKSVSVVFGLAEPQLRDEVIAAHEIAVEVALRWLEREAVVTRRGRNGWRTVTGDGFVGAAFRHRSSRAGDPHLHTHVVVANATFGEDGRWSTLDSKRLYRSAKTAGYLYELQLRYELTRRLGLSWEPTVNGIADLVAVPKPVREEFSRRAREIQAFLAAHGQDSPAAAEWAALATRQAKNHQIDGRQLRADWTHRAAQHGFGPAVMAAAVSAPPAPRGPVYPSQVFAFLASPDGLTKHDSTFDRNDVLRAICELAPSSSDTTRIEALADEYLIHPEVVTVGGPSRHTLARCTTKELLEVERAAVDYAVRTGRPRDPSLTAIAERAIGASGRLSDEQADMVRALADSDRAVEVIVAAAGTGKTFTLATMARAWSTAGYRVRGCALAARAAYELEDATKIPGASIARLLSDLEHGRTRLDARSVLVVDEAAMVGTRTIARIFAHAEHAKARVVLVGDPRQLTEIEAGGRFAAIARARPPIGLTVNRRQREPWERVALDELRDGNITNAIAAYHEHGRIRHGPLVSEQLIADWWNSHRDGDTVLILASRRETVKWLNLTARACMRRGGQLHGPEVATPNGRIRAGDRVMLLKTDDRLHLANGTLATVERVDVQDRSLEIIDQRGRAQHVPAAYIDAGNVGYGYAATIHKTQGTTIDRSFVWVTQELQRESAYSALSRGRQSNHLYLSTDHGLDIDLKPARRAALPGQPDVEQHLPGPAPETPISELTRQLAHNNRKQLADDFDLGL